MPLEEGPHGPTRGDVKPEPARSNRPDVEPPRVDTSVRVFFFDAYPHVYAGAQRVTHRIARGLTDRGHRVTVGSVASGPFTEALADDDVDVTIVAAPAALSRYGRTTTGTAAAAAAWALPRYWLRLWWVMRRYRPDIVHVDDLRGLLLAGAPARLLAARLVWHIHALEARPRLNRMGARLAHAVAVPAAAVIEREPELGQRSAPTVVVNPAPRHATCRPTRPDPPLLLTIGRIHPDKGIDVLVRAAALLGPEAAEVCTVVLGGSQQGYEHLEAELHSLAAELGVAGRVHFEGFSDDPGAWLDRTSVYVQPSLEHTEILPLAVLEAMSAGCPVVASDVGAMREAVVPDVTGILVPAGEPAALANAISALLADPERARRLGVAGRARAEQHFNPQRCVDDVEALYQSLLGGGSQ